MHTFTFHSDAGHGWVEVPLAVLKDLGIADKITSYSYMRTCTRDGVTAYLEEDCDAGTFLKAYTAKHGTKPDFTEDWTEYSFIRNLWSYAYTEGGE